MAIKSQWFHILLSLAGGTRHGAEIRRSVREHTGGKVRLYPAMLYGSLDDLQKLGWIGEVGEGEGRPAGENERRRYYRLTDRGREALADEADRLEALARLARGFLTDGEIR